MKYLNIHAKLDMSIYCFAHCITLFPQSQSRQTEKSLKEEFKKLHQFLKKEEDSRIAALNTEEKDKRGRIESIIQRRIQSLSDMIREMEEEINDISDVDFLQVSVLFTLCFVVFYNCH